MSERELRGNNYTEEIANREQKWLTRPHIPPRVRDFGSEGIPETLSILIAKRAASECDGCTVNMFSFGEGVAGSTVLNHKGHEVITKVSNCGRSFVPLRPWWLTVRYCLVPKRPRIRRAHQRLEFLVVALEVELQVRAVGSRRWRNHSSLLVLAGAHLFFS